MLMAQDQDKDYGVNGVIIIIGELPGGPVVRTLYFQCQGCGFNPLLGKLRSCKLLGAAETRQKEKRICVAGSTTAH